MFRRSGSVRMTSPGLFGRLALMKVPLSLLLTILYALVFSYTAGTGRADGFPLPSSLLSTFSFALFRIPYLGSSSLSAGTGATVGAGAGARLRLRVGGAFAALAIRKRVKVQQFHASRPKYFAR